MKKYLALAVAGVMALGLAGCSSSSGSASGSKGDKQVLNVYNWGDYIDEEVLDMFEQETGIQVNYETFATNEDMYVKIKNGGTDYDIAIPSDYMIERMVNEDLLETIDTSQLENYGQIDDFFKNLSYDPNNEYSVPYMWGTLGIVYNTTMVDKPVTSWDILWDADYAGSIFMYNSQRDSIGVALKRLGYSLNTRDMDELAAARDSLIEQKPLVLSYLGDNIKDSMIAGEAALSVMYSGDAVYCMSYNEDLAYAVPNEGSNYWFDGIVIPKTCQNKEAALKFIDFLCRPDVALMNTEYIGYSTPITGAREMLSEEMLENPAYSPSAETLEKCELFYDLGDFLQEYDKAWTEIFAS